MKQTTTPSAIKKLFIIPLILAALVSMVELAINAIQQYNNNTNINGLLPWMIMDFAPLLLVVIGYVSRTNRKHKLDMWFEICIASISVMMISSALSSLLFRLIQPVAYDENSVTLLNSINQFIPLVISLLIVGYVVFRLRQAKKW